MRSYTIVFAIALSGCVARAPEPITLAQVQQRAAQDAYRKCLRDVTRAVWWRNWDLHVMHPEIERICSEHTGRRYVAVPGM